MPIALYIGLGIITGIFAGVFGVGGGLILVPALVLVFGFEQFAANATSLVALLLPVGFFGVLEYYRAGKISVDQIKVGLIIALGMFLGTFLGARLAVSLDQQVMRKLFSAFLLIVAVKLWMQ